MGRTRAVADYAVVPLLGCEVEATVEEVVTDTWLVRYSARREMEIIKLCKTVIF